MEAEGGKIANSISKDHLTKGVLGAFLREKYPQYDSQLISYAFWHLLCSGYVKQEHDESTGTFYYVVEKKLDF